MRKNNAVNIITGIVLAACVFGASAYADEESTKNILKQGLLGAGVGAISSGASGGKAGQGALIGAGTSVIGSALLDAITGPSSSSSSRAPARAPAAQQAPVYYSDEPEEYYVEEAPPQESGTQKVLKQGLVGAGVGAISAGASGGKAGQGALIGAGTNVIGNALLDTITQPPQARQGKVYRRIPKQQKTYSSEEGQASGEAGTRKKVIKKYDESGKLVSEEEIYY